MNDRGEAQAIKTTFCLVDFVKPMDNSSAWGRHYFDCFGTQGISVDWADSYH